MANEYLKRTYTSTGNLKVGTFSFWIKGRPYDTNQTRPVYLYDGSNLFQVFVERTSGTNPGQIVIYGASADIRYKGIYRDPSAWSHYLIKVDNTTNGAEARFEVYVNGVKLEIVGSQSTSTASYPARDANVFNNVYYINGTGNGAFQCCDYFFVDSQALTPDVFGFYKQGKGYISAGSAQATDFRPGQWVPKTPRAIKTEINRRGGFGVNGFYLPMNDSNNFGADFHCDPNSIIVLNEKLPQPRVGVASTASVGLGYTDALRADPYAANLVLALPFVSSGLCTNGTNVGVNTGFGDYAPSIKRSGSANIGVKYGDTTIVTVGSASSAGGYYGSSVYFDGTGDYFDTGYSLNTTFGSGNYTIEGWIYSFDDQNERGVFGNIANQYGISLRQFGSYAPQGNQTLFATFGQSASGYTAATTVRIQDQWNHIAMVKNGVVGTLYLNGVAVGIATNVTAPSFTTSNLVVGAYYSSSYPFRGYIQDFRVYNTAKYTGGFDVPRPYTPVGIATWRQVPDTTANNFATLNPIDARSNTVTFADGNLSFTSGSVTQSRAASTIGVSTGKYYFEARLNAVGGTYPAVGVCGIVTSVHDTFVGQDAGSFGYYSNGGVNGTGGNGGTYSTYTTGDIIGVGINLTNSQLTFYKNGSNAVTSGTTYEPLTSGNGYRAAVSCFTSGTNGKWDVNFGQNPTFSGNTTAGTFTDTNGKGLFKYQPPSGFLALCEDNLPTPAISDPGKYFKTVLYTGDGNTGRSIVGVGFTPDLVWVKGRTETYYHRLTSTLLTQPNYLAPNATDAEGTLNNRILSLNADGFTLDANGTGGTNTSGQPYVAWCWRAGAGTTSTNTNGSITSVVSVNQDAGFSIVSFTGTGAQATFGHGLGKIPKFILMKRRTGGTNNWSVYHSSLGLSHTTYPNWLYLNATSVEQSSVSSANHPLYQRPDSSLIYLNTGTSESTNVSGSTYIAYCWAEIENFSKFGSYVGNGNADGPFVYCGFKPAFIIFKNVSAVGNWIMKSNHISSNPNGYTLLPDASDTEYAPNNTEIDFLSNGFKNRTTSSLVNGSGNTIIFAAFAESPFQTANSK